MVMSASKYILALALLLFWQSCTLRAGHVPLTSAALSKDVSDRAPSTKLLSFAHTALEQRIAMAASEVVGQNRVKVGNTKYRADCSGTTRGIYAKAGFEIVNDSAMRAANDVAQLYELAKRRGSVRKTRPRVGDLVFFDNTYDKNHDGRRNDPLSHVGVVEKIEKDGTLLFVHRIQSGIVRFRMNLLKPNILKNSEGVRINHQLVRSKKGQKGRTAAELFAGFGTLPASSFQLNSATLASK